MEHFQRTFLPRTSESKIWFQAFMEGHPVAYTKLVDENYTSIGIHKFESTDCVKTTVRLLLQHYTPDSVFDPQDTRCTVFSTDGPCLRAWLFWVKFSREESSHVSSFGLVAGCVKFGTCSGDDGKQFAASPT